MASRNTCYASHICTISSSSNGVSFSTMLDDDLLLTPTILQDYDPFFEAQQDIKSSEYAVLPSHLLRTQMPTYPILPDEIQKKHRKVANNQKSTSPHSNTDISVAFSQIANIEIFTSFWKIGSCV